VFHLAEKYPEHFDEELDKLCYKRMKGKFKPWKIQKTIDVYTAGGLNYQSLNHLRTGVEGLAKGQRGFIPHGSTVRLRAVALQDHAVLRWKLGFSNEQTDYGRLFKFDFDILFRLIMERTGLEKYAADPEADPVVVAFTSDGAKLTNHLNHVTAGVKLLDPRTVDPLSNKTLAELGNFQSRNWCFPF
jgi:hypothetical protein